MAAFLGPLVLFRRTAQVAGCAAIGAAAAQLPAFVQQYLQRLGGHLDEARFMALQFAEGDAYRDLSPAVRAAVLEVTERRIEWLAGAHDAIAQAGDLSRPFVFLTHVDHSIAAATWRVFEPGLPLGWGGLAYGGAAALLAYLAVSGAGAAWHRWRQPKHGLPESGSAR